MRNLLLLLICAILLVAQQTNEKQKKIEHCGLGSSHDCRCIRHSHAVQDAYSEQCNVNSKSEKELQDCLSKLPSHCSIVERDDASYDDDTDDQSSAMSERCTMMCKKHDCLCDDGPRCHIGHSEREHERSSDTPK
jgi:hypothetical protein